MAAAWVKEAGETSRTTAGKDLTSAVAGLFLVVTLGGYATPNRRAGMASTCRMSGACADNEGANMKVYQELTIFGPRDRLAVLPDRIEKRLNNGWTRDRSRNMELFQGALAEGFRFHCEPAPGRKGADLWLFLEGDQLRVSNIVPSLDQSLSYAEYNQILTEFAETFVAPAAGEMGLRISITKPKIGIRDLLPAPVADALETFSRTANKTTGASHPSDKERWESFVIGAHRANAEFDPSTLARWLIEEEHWPPEIANELSVEYQQERSILEQYDRQLQDA